MVLKAVGYRGKEDRRRKGNQSIYDLHGKGEVPICFWLQPTLRGP